LFFLAPLQRFLEDIEVVQQPPVNSDHRLLDQLIFALEIDQQQSDPGPTPCKSLVRNKFPSELLLKVFLHLCSWSMLLVRRVSKSWCQTANDNRLLWRRNLLPYKPRAHLSSDILYLFSRLGRERIREVEINCGMEDNLFQPLMTILAENKATLRFVNLRITGDLWRLTELSEYWRKFGHLIEWRCQHQRFPASVRLLNTTTLEDEKVWKQKEKEEGKQWSHLRVFWVEDVRVETERGLKLIRLPQFNQLTSLRVERELTHYVWNLFFEHNCQALQHVEIKISRNMT